MRTPGRGAGPGDATAGDRGPRSPSFLARWWSRSIAAIGSDLALHGLAYLGVLLLFVGSFGLVAFAFGDVSGSLRPIAEVALVVAPFAAARMLLRRGAVVAGRALELAGGLILPIMVITSLLDGFGLPPDLTGAPLVVTLTGAVGALSVGYAWWSSRHPDSALRYLVAPTAWVAAALAGMGIGREIPSGSGVASVTAAQIGLVAAGMTVSAALARWRPASLLAGPTVTACVVGAPIVGLVAVLSWLAESYPAAPIAVTGVLGLVLLELLAVRLQPTWALGAQTAWWGVVSIGLGGSPELGPAPASAIALVGFVGLLESGSARRTTPTLLVLPAILAAVALVPTWQEPWWAVGATAATAVWAVVRRSTRAFMVALAPQAFDAAAAILPAAAVAAFWRASQDDVAALLVVAGLVLVATVPATRPLLRRTPDDPFWSGFWGVAIVLAVAAAALVTAEAYPASANRVWLLAGAVAMLTIAAGVGPVAAEARPWVVAGLGGWTWLLASDAAGLSADVRAVVVAGVGVVLVGVGHGVRGLPVGVAGGWALVGHVVGGFALVLPGSEWGLTAVVFLATVGWGVTGWFDVADRSPVGVVLAGVGPWVRFVPLVLVAVGVPVTVGLALSSAGVLAWGDAWWPVVPAVTAVGYAAASRLAVNGRVLGVLVWGAVVAGLGAPVVASQVWPAVVALAGLVAGVVLMAPAGRPVFMVWVAWSALAPLVGLVAVGSSEGFGGLPPEQSAAVTLIVVGAVMVLLAIGAVPGRSWQLRRGRPDAVVLPPMVVGGVEVVAGLVVAWASVPGPLGGWLTLAVAGVVLGVAVLARVGVLDGVSAALAWVGVLLLAPDWVGDHPWSAVVVAGVLLLVCEGLGRLSRERVWWARWDLGLFVVAHLCAVTALAITADDGQTGVTWAATGLLAVAVALRLRANQQVATGYAAAGTTLVLWAAATQGPGWLALALAALAIALTALAGQVGGAPRGACQFGGALSALAAWVALADWQAWSVPTTIDTTSLAAALVALGLAGALRSGRIDRSWVVSWGAVTGLTAAMVPTWALVAATSNVDPSAATFSALLIVVVAAQVVATPLDAPWLRPLGVILLFEAEIHALVLWGASPGRQVAVLCATSLMSSVVLIATRRRAPAQGQQRSMVLLGVVANAAAVAVAAGQLPESTLLVPSLLVGAVLAAVIGLVLGSLGVMALSPVLACAAWLAFANEALSGNPQWYLVPIGLALLAVVALVRQDRRERGLDPAGRGIVVLELAGIGVVVGPSLVQSLTESLGYALLAAGLGLCTIWWGVLTRVRRRVAAGAAVVMLAVLELVVVPLAQVLPAWGGAGTWVLIIAVGLLAISAATLLEWGRATVRRATASFAELTEGWE